MPKYLFKASFAAEGVAGVIAEGGTARREVVSKAVQELGGDLECLYYTFGDADVIAICELPDNETAASFALQVSSSGRVSVATTVLLSPEQVDRAVAKKSSWRAPGA